MEWYDFSSYVSRTFVGSKVTFNINYFEQGTLNNFITVTLGDGQDHAMFMNLIQVKKMVFFMLRVTLIYHT